VSSSVDTAVEIRPFEVEIADEQIADLRRRIEWRGGRAKSLSAIGRRESSWRR
jgi:hypothetical protein